jgi:hypothetical protein
MPVNTHHPDYAYRSSDWSKIRDFAEGARAVRARAETYLPKPTGWKDDEYNSYKLRAEVYGAVDRTIDGLDGAIFRKPPTQEIPDGEAEALVEDITLAGQTVVEWSRALIREILTVGRMGVLVEFTGSEVAPRPTIAPGAGPGRPYVVSYPAETIINWETAVINGETKLVMVVLEERIQIDSPSDPFVKASQFQYRILRLVKGAYTVELWTEEVVAPPTGGNAVPVASKEKRYVKTQEITPVRRGAPLDRIPFFFIGPSGQSVSPEKPPLLDIVDLCILHYMTSADYAHGLHWVGLPTPYVCGARDKESIQIGPSTAIVLDDPQAKVGMLEFSGSGLKEIKDRLQGLEGKMAALGARILEEQKREAESGEALKLRQGGDASVLAGISDAVSRAAEAIIARMLWWAGTEASEPDVTFSLNMDFFGTPMDPQMIVALMQAQQSGLISKETFVWNLKRGEMLPETTSIEDELEKAANDAPPMPSPAEGGGGGGE